jgi:hypothetical protein
MSSQEKPESGKEKRLKSIVIRHDDDLPEPTSANEVSAEADADGTPADDGEEAPVRELSASGSPLKLKRIGRIPMRSATEVASATEEQDEKGPEEKAAEAGAEKNAVSAPSKPLRTKLKMPPVTPSAIPAAPALPPLPPPAEPEPPAEEAPEEPEAAPAPVTVAPPKPKLAGTKLRQSNAPPAPAPLPPPAESVAPPPPVEPLVERAAGAEAEGKLRLQSRQTVLPANLSTPPEDAIKPGEKPRKQRGPSGFPWAAMIVAWLVITAGNAVSLMPAWQQWAENRSEVPRPEMLLLGVATVVFGALILSGKVVSRLLAGILALLLMLCAAGFIVVPAFFWDLIPEGTVSVADLSQLPSPAVLLASILLYLGGIVLITGGTVVQWSLATILVAVGIAVPWLPLDNILPPRPVGPPIVEFADFKIELPDTWMMVRTGRLSKKGNRVVFAQAEGPLTVEVERQASISELTLAECTEKMLREFREEYAAVAQFDVPGRPDQKRLVVLDGVRMETRIIRKAENIYSVSIRADKDEFNERESEVRDILNLL